MLAKETQKVWDILKNLPLLDGFVLIGGTALALHINHRISEDLDLAYTDTTLPGQRLDRLLQLGDSLGLSIERNDDPLAVEDFLNSGLELHDSHQDFVFNGAVKVTFFSPPKGTMNVIRHYGRQGTPQVASVNEIYQTKALVTADRSKTRDWFDLYILMSKYGYDADDFIRAFLNNGAKLQLDTALKRLCTCIPDPGDESYLAVVEEPLTLDDFKIYFQGLRDKVETRIASGFKKTLNLESKKRDRLF